MAVRALRHHKLTCAALLLAAASALAAEESADDIDPAEVGAVVLQMVSVLDEADVDACNATIDRLTEMEPERRLGILHAYVTVAGDSVQPFRREVLDVVLDRLGESAVRQVLREAVADGSTLVERSLALRLVRDRDLSGGMDIVLLAVRNEDSSNLRRPFVLRAYRETIATVLGREPRSLTALQRSFATLPAPLQDAALDVFERRPEEFGTRAFSRFLGADARLDEAVLPRLMRLPILDQQPLVDGAPAHIAWSLDDGDPEIRRLAAHVAGRFHLTELAPRLVAALEDEDPRVVSAAHRALQRMSGARLIAKTDLWEAWLDGETEWADERLGAALEDVRSADAETVRAGLEQLARHRYHRERITSGLADALGHATPAVRARACDVLGALGSPGALSMLRTRLADPEEDVAAAASEALARVTGLDAPEDPADWSARLEHTR